MTDIERLYAYCRDREDKYLEIKEMFGPTHPLAVERLYELLGAEKAFKYLSGYTITDYMIHLMTTKDK